MKYVKILVLAAFAAMALTAMAAGSASASTTLHSGSTVLEKGAVIDFAIPSGGSALLVDTENKELDKCSTSTVKGTLTTPATGAANTGVIEQLTWGGPCTFPTNTLTKGKLEVVATGGTTGDVKADATIEVTINTVFFGSCIYGVTSGTKVGSLSGNPATFTANAVAEKFSGSNFACPATSKWTGSYNASEPNNFHVEED